MMKRGLIVTLFNLHILFGILICFPKVGFSVVHLSDLPASEGRRAPFRHRERENLGQRFRNETKNGDGEMFLGGFNELLPYVMPSPDQEDAGSCLYMANTGIAEWWLAKLNPRFPRTADGPLDLSERYLMNVAGIEENETDLPNWRTDSIYLFNRNHQKTMLNSAYRYTKGWYAGEAYSDRILPASPGATGAEYGTLYNWIDQRPAGVQGEVSLPLFERDVIFADPEANQWNVGVAPDNIVEKVKETLRTKKAPVLVIYNHDSYWHAVYVIGYNDTARNGNCDYTEQFRIDIAARAEELAKKAAEAIDPTVKSAYEIRAKRAREAKDKIERAYATRGGCRSKQGVFYIRDSIYPDEGGPVYHYDLTNPAADAPYAKKIVFKEYDWLRYFANHISVVYPK